MIGNDYAGDGAGNGNGGFVSQYQNFIAGLGTADWSRVSRVTTIHCQLMGPTPVHS